MFIGGQIVDETGLPFSGASIYIPIMFGGGTTSDINGTTSDINGNWQIQANENDVITFSFMGFKKVNYSVDKVPSKIVLYPDTALLPNVTVTAKKAGMSLVGKLLLAGLFLGLVAKAIPGIAADAKQSTKTNNKGLNGSFAKVKL